MTYNSFQAYEEYLVPALFVPGAEVLLKYAAPKTGERVLDVATGTGIVARKVAPLLGTTGKITALDISPQMLKVAKTQLEGAMIDWREGSVTSMPFENGSFDLVLCQQGLQFFPDQPAAIKEMYRVLTRGGRIVFSVNQSLDQFPLYQTLNDLLMRHLGTQALTAPFTSGDANALSAMMVEAGFDLPEVISVTYTAEFKDASRFVYASVIGSAAAVTALAELDSDAQSALIETLEDEIKSALKPYIKNGVLTFPMPVYIGRGVVQ